MATQPNVNKFNYLLNDVTINHDTMRTAGIVINSSTSGEVDLSKYNTIGFFIKDGDSSFVIDSITTLRGQKINNFFMRPSVYYPISISKIESSSAIDIMILYREP